MRLRSLMGRVRSMRGTPVAAAPSAPTVLLNAAYATDTLLDEGDAAVGNGSRVHKWTMSTGGLWTFALAEPAGALVAPVNVTASGVHTGGDNAALTCTTPVTIPADTDCVIYVKANLGAYESTMVPLGLSTGGYLEINSGDTELGHDVTLGLDGTFTNYVGGRLGGSITTGVHLIRLIRASGAWTFAATGTASFSPATGGTVAGAFSFNTLLARGSSGTLDLFSSSAMCLQKLKISYGSSSPDTAYELANGGLL